MAYQSTTTDAMVGHTHYPIPKATCQVHIWLLLIPYTQQQQQQQGPAAGNVAHHGHAQPPTAVVGCAPTFLLYTLLLAPLVVGWAR
jgi:hypothetical protein